MNSPQIRVKPGRTEQPPSIVPFKPVRPHAAEYPALNDDERDYIKALRRRALHLDKRIANYDGRSDSFDRHELTALLWVLGEVDARYRHHG